jgi:hypothetical protein
MRMIRRVTGEESFEDERAENRAREAADRERSAGELSG